MDKLWIPIFALEGWWSANAITWQQFWYILIANPFLLIGFGFSTFYNGVIWQFGLLSADGCWSPDTTYPSEENIPFFQPRKYRWTKMTNSRNLNLVIW